ncbi:hypothetical protein Taro_044599 [Colocasia esculenta]|uniref:Uncharacterized protein n=1 Tax=Colocasia esculenta TaxID=4460 RepID=A0A843X5M5_COLES|nr:hypothetical protein [Colocasia esculenta]
MFSSPSEAELSYLAVACLVAFVGICRDAYPVFSVDVMGVSDLKAVSPQVRRRDGPLSHRRRIRRFEREACNQREFRRMELCISFIR